MFIDHLMMDSINRFNLSVVVHVLARSADQTYPFRWQSFLTPMRNVCGGLLILICLLRPGEQVGRAVTAPSLVTAYMYSKRWPALLSDCK
jgi:hypothetical protein